MSDGKKALEAFRNKFHTTRFTDDFRVDPHLVAAVLKEVASLEAENKRLRKAIEAIIDFHNAPRQAQRPDFYQILMRRARAALKDTAP